MSLFPDKPIIAKFRHGAVWDNEDGTWGHRIYALPVHRLVDGQWREMDNAILAPGRYRIDGNEVQITLSDLELHWDEHVQKLASPDLSRLEVGANYVRWEFPFPDMALEHWIGIAGVKSKLIIQKFPTLPRADGSIAITGSLSGHQDLQTHHYNIYDAQGQPGIGSLQIQPDGYFIMSVDVAWLEQAAYPVIIDPTIQTEGNDVTVTRGSVQGQIHECIKTFTKYDITSIPDDADITAATTNHYCNAAGEQTRAYDVKKANSQTWLETDSGSDLDAIALGASLESFSVPLSVQWYSWNVRYGSNSDGIEADVSGGNQYFTPCLHYDYTANPVKATFNNTSNYLGQGTPPPTGADCINSAEAESNTPYLDVTYTAGVTRRMSARMRFGKEIQASAGPLPYLW